MPNKKKNTQKKENHWDHWFWSVPLVAIFFVALLFLPADQMMAVAFHQSFIEGEYPEIRNSIADLNDVDRVFNFVFAALGDEVIVYPTENYYYFVFKSHGQEVWGNFHFPPADEIGEYVDFAYWKFENSPNEEAEIFSRYKRYDATDGLSIKKLSDLKYLVSYQNKSTAFSLNNLDQSLPPGAKLKKDEVLAARTFDESGYQFLLIYNKTQKHFMFVVDESRVLPEKLTATGAEVWVGERSGFAFYQDDIRKVLIGVRLDNIRRNNYFDGPFDQLADNFAQSTKFSEYLQSAYPYSKGRIDKYGRFTDVEHSRLALTPYNFYYEPQELSAIIKRCSVEEFFSCITYDVKEVRRS